MTGTAVTYNREATLPAASFYDVGDTWTEATPTFTTVTAALKIMGGDADVDNFLQATYADPNDLEAEVIASRSRAVAHKFLDTNFPQYRPLTGVTGRPIARLVICPPDRRRRADRFQRQPLAVVVESSPSSTRPAHTTESRLDSRVARFRSRRRPAMTSRSERSSLCRSESARSSPSKGAEASGSSRAAMDRARLNRRRSTSAIRFATAAPSSASACSANCSTSRAIICGSRKTSCHAVPYRRVERRAENAE